MPKLFSIKNVLSRSNLGTAVRLLLLLLVAGIVYATPSWAANCGDAKFDVQRTKIAADVAAKRSLSAIIKEAVDAGMDIECVIGLLIQAGADSQAVVYTAIADGYPADKVVKGALNAKADLQMVVNAAIGAGADRTQICKGAVDAGISSSDCSNACASATVPGSYRYYSSGSYGSYIYTPGTVVFGGGGGGGTSPASPHKPYSK